MKKMVRRAGFRLPAGWDSKPWLSIAVLVLMVALRIIDPSTMERLRLTYFDLLQSALPGSESKSHVVIVDVDDASLALVGQWPWARSTVARLTSEIAAMKPAAIGFDLLFPEPDQLSAEEIVRSLPSINDATRSRLQSLPSNDALLAASFRGVPVVLALSALPTAALIGYGADTTPVSVVTEAGTDARAFLTRYTNLITNIPALDAAAAGRGMVTLAPDADGVLRRSAGVIVVRDHIFPSLAVEMARVATKQPGMTLVADELGVSSIRIAGVRLPTDQAGNLWLHYAGPRALQILSAADILAGRISTASISGKFVLLGITAGRMSDYHATPVGDRRSGLAIHAQLLQNILDGDLLMRPSYMTRYEVVLLLLAGILFIAAARRLHGWRLLPLFVILLLLLFGISALAFTHARLLIDPTFPALLAILLYMSTMTQEIFGEEQARRRTEEQLRAALLRAETASKAKTDFLANMSHELRTPLTAILGFSDTIRHELFGPITPPKYGDYINEIHASGSHLLAIVSDVLDMSRVEAGETKIEDDEIDLAVVIDESVNLLRSRVDRKRLEMRKDVDPALPHLRADRRMLKQMIINLLSNAVTYTPDGGRITVTTLVDSDRRIAIAIKDSGIGIARIDLDRVMEPFQIVENPHARSYQGIGLGLPLTRAFVQLHGGQLTLESEIGMGTAATLTFPAARTIESLGTRNKGLESAAGPRYSPPPKA